MLRVCSWPMLNSNWFSLHIQVWVSVSCEEVCGPFQDKAAALTLNLLLRSSRVMRGGPFRLHSAHFEKLRNKEENLCLKPRSLSKSRA